MDKREQIENVAKLVTLAQGERSRREMARETGIAASYINGIENKKYLPSADILRKIANGNPRKGVTLKALMVAAGYDTEVSTEVEQLRMMIHQRDLIIKEQREMIDKLLGKLI